MCTYICIYMYVYLCVSARLATYKIMSCVKTIVRLGSGHRLLRTPSDPLDERHKEVRAVYYIDWLIECNTAINTPSISIHTFNSLAIRLIHSMKGARRRVHCSTSICEEIWYSHQYILNSNTHHTFMPLKSELKWKEDEECSKCNYYIHSMKAMMKGIAIISIPSHTAWSPRWKAYKGTFSVIHWSTMYSIYLNTSTVKHKNWYWVIINKEVFQSPCTP